MRQTISTVAISLAVAVATAAGGCDYPTVPAGTDTATHPRGDHDLFPSVSAEEGQQASGVTPDEALEQPIQFTHHRHVTVLQMDCEYCHTEARRSQHAGVPPVEACMGCHSQVLTDSPQIQKIASYWENQEPIPWKKVHDLPDYVYFTHARHVQAGVDCTECHGQVPLMGKWPQGDAEQATVMWREASLQMGWCLECHQNHPSIDENHGDQADLRRVQLKDCWTCHK